MGCGSVAGRNVMDILYEIFPFGNAFVVGRQNESSPQNTQERYRRCACCQRVPSCAIRFDDRTHDNKYMMPIARLLR